MFWTDYLLGYIGHDKLQPRTVWVSAFWVCNWLCWTWKGMLIQLGYLALSMKLLAPAAFDLRNLFGSSWQALKQNLILCTTGCLSRAGYSRRKFLKLRTVWCWLMSLRRPTRRSWKHLCRWVPIELNCDDNVHFKIAWTDIPFKKSSLSAFVFLSDDWPYPKCSKLFIRASLYAQNNHRVHELA